ncbi:MAG TPA: hypothetical protein VL996_14965 [Methylocella sp.]|nr:hypothetical protein [Methylocella sp.]
MRSIEAVFLSLGVWVLSASLHPPRAEDGYDPAENDVPFGQMGGAVRGPVKTEGELSQNLFGKPCLIYAPYARPYVVDTHMSDYVVGVTNSCPRAIKIRICQNDGSGCSRAVVPAYQSTDVVMGFGPLTDVFNYIARETP